MGTVQYFLTSYILPILTLHSINWKSWWKPCGF